MAENEDEIPNNNEQNESTGDIQQVREGPGIIENDQEKSKVQMLENQQKILEKLENQDEILKTLASIQNDQKKFNEEMLVNQQKLLENIAIQDKLLEGLDSIQNELKEVKENQKVVEPVKKIIHAPEIPQKKEEITGTVKPCKFVLRNVFKDVSKMEENKAYHSDIEEHFGVLWRLAIIRKEEHLAAFLHIKRSGIADDREFSIDVRSVIKVINTSGTPIIKSVIHCFTEFEGRGYDTFIKWEELMKDYLTDDKLTVEAHVDICKTTGVYKENLKSFDVSAEKFSDVVLIVKDEKFYVLKKYLANHSTYFEALFLGKFNESEKGEVILSGIDAYDFQNYLEVLYGEEAIDEYAVEGILLVADMFDTPIVIRKCETFLLKESKKTLKKKLQMSIRYNLNKLKEKCLSEIKTSEDIQSVIPGDINDLEPSLMAALLGKALTLL